MTSNKAKLKSTTKPPPRETGRLWTYYAIDPESNFIIAYLTGERNFENTREFVRRIERTLKRDKDGQLVVKPTIATDGMPGYEDAFGHCFHAEINYGQYVKRYARKGGGRWRKFDGADRRALIGQPDEKLINTTYVERQNLNHRMYNRRLTRKSNGFSKKIVDHERQEALTSTYLNYVWIQRPKRPPEGSPPGTSWVKRGTAANLVGIDNKVWEMKDFIQRIDAYHLRLRAEAANDNEPPEEVVEVVEGDEVHLAPPYWVYINHLAHSAKVHKAECVNCRDGQGKHGGSRPGTAEWKPFYSLESAQAEAEQAAPERNADCSMCLGRYRDKVRNVR